MAYKIVVSSRLIMLIEDVAFGVVYVFVTFAWNELLASQGVKNRAFPLAVAEVYSEVCYDV